MPAVTRRRWWLLGLAVVCAGWALGGEWVSIHHAVPENHFIDLMAGLAFLACGIITLDRRPGNAIGPLMIAYGIIGYFGNWGNINVPLLPLLGVSIGQLAGAPILAQIALSYPTGRLRTTFDRVVIGLIYATAAAAVVVILLVFDPRSAGCTACAWEPAPFPSRTAFIAVTTANQRAGGVLALLFLTAVWLRFRRATPAERRDLAPLWVAVCVIAIVYVLDAFASPFPLANPFAYLLWELQTVLQISLPVIFVWGLLSARLARSAVGDLVVELGRPLPPGELQASLARTLRDPSLELLYALAGQGRWVNAGGQHRSLPRPAEGSQARTVTLVERDGRPLAALIHDPALDQGLVRASAAAAGIAIENERLHAEVRAQLEEVRASRQRIVEAGDRERRRVERNLHDGAQQRLATLALSLAMMRDRDGADPTTAEALAQALAELKQAIDELRELARGIHPAILTEEGLPAAVESLADRSRLPIGVAADFDARLPGPVETAAYFVVSESLANVAKYAHASRAQVRLSRRNGTLRVEVLDDGVGGADLSQGSGLRGLADRVAAMRGSFRVETPPGGGTRVLAEIPCDA
jgi:signal transduction histidine kinase